MTSKVENHDSPSSGSSTNQKRRHSTGQGQRSKAASSEGDSKRIKDDHQHGLTNGHDERRHSSDSYSKNPPDNNKENAHGQNTKEDITEKKKKKRRKKKKGGGGGVGVGAAAAATTAANTAKENNSGNGSDDGASQSAENEAKSSETCESPRSRGKLTHTSSEEQSDDTGSTHTEEACYVELQASSKDPARVSPTRELVDVHSEATESVDREPIGSSIDQAPIIDTVSTSINSSTNNTVEADDGVECKEHTGVEDVNNATSSIEKTGTYGEGSSELDVMSHRQAGCLQDVSTDDEGSSVDAVLTNSPNDFQDTDLFIQEASDLAEQNCDKSDDVPGNHVGETRKDTLDLLSDPLKIEESTSFICETNRGSCNETTGEQTQEKIGTGNLSKEDNSEIATLDNEPGEDKSDPSNCQQNQLEKSHGPISLGLENKIDPDSKQCNLPNELNPVQSDTENCLSNHMDLEYSMTKHNDHELSIADESQTDDTSIADSDKTRYPDEDQSTTRPKREISIVDLIGARATAGSAIRAGIIQDMMLSSGNCGSSGDTSPQASAGSSGFKLDITDAPDVECYEEHKKSSVPMTQQKPQQEEHSNVDSLVNGRIDIAMEQQKLLEHHGHEQEQTICEEVAPCVSPFNAVDDPVKQQYEADDKSSGDLRPGVELTSDEGKQEPQEKTADLEKEGNPKTPDKHVHFEDTPILERILEAEMVSEEEHGKGETHCVRDKSSELVERTNELFDTAKTSAETQEQTHSMAVTGQLWGNPEKHHSTEWHDEAMTNLQAYAQAQQAKANLMITSLRARLRKRDIEMHNVREGHERQLSAVVAHLLRLEGEMQKEQKQVLEALADRDDIIRRQKVAIDDLTEKNDRLMKTLKESQRLTSRNGVPHQNGDISIRDHGNKVVIRGTKGRSSGRSVKSNSGEFKSNGEKPKVRFTTAMMDRLRRHKSSLELYKPEPLEPLIEGHLRYYSSQDNLVDDEGEEGGEQTDSPKRVADKTPMRREGNLQRKQRCRSLVDYPFIGDLEEMEEEIGGSSESWYDEGFSSSPSRISRHDSGLSSSMSSLTGSGETSNWVRRWSAGGGGSLNGGRPRGMSADLASSSSCSSPQSPSSPNSFPPSSKSKPSSSSSSSSPSSPYGFSELSKSRSVPHALPTVSENDAVVGASPGGTSSKERPHSLTSVELFSGDLSRSNSTNSTSTPNLAPAGSASSVAVSSSPPSSSSSESNPFKSFKNVFKRRGSKKKRSVALNQTGNQEHSETVKNYFKKHDLT